MQALLAERDASIKQTELIDARIYAEHTRLRIDRAHDYIQNKYATLGDEYYILAEDIANHLLSDFRNHYELDSQRTAWLYSNKQICAVEELPIYMVVTINGHDIIPPMCASKARYVIDGEDNDYYDNVLSGSHVDLHRFNRIANEHADMTSVTSDLNKEYLDALYLDSNTLSYDAYVKTLKSHVVIDRSAFSDRSQMIFLDIPLVAIKYSPHTVGSNTKSDVQF